MKVNLKVFDSKRKIAMARNSRINLSLLLSIILYLSVFYEKAAAQVILPRLVSDSMVLQRDTKLKIWGWASEGEVVTVNFRGETYKTVADKQLKWTINVNASHAGGPYNMVIRGKNAITIKSIMVGDVWLCSGQSNMEFEIKKASEKYAEVIKNSHNANIRQFVVAKKTSFINALDDVSSEGWKTANPRNILNFTAVGYFFARDLYARYKVPIGLINATWGGTPAEAWVSEEGIKKFDNYSATLNRLKDPEVVKALSKHDQQITADWYDYIRLYDQGLLSHLKWYDVNYDFSQWKNTVVPLFWESGDLKSAKGVVWFKKEVEISSRDTGINGLLLLGNIYNQDSTWVNGVKVGFTGDKHTPRRYYVKKGLLKAGKNIITIRVVNPDGLGGFVQGKPYQLSLGGTIFELSGDWQYRIGVSSARFPGTTNLAYQPSVLFKGMIAPLLNYSLKGFLWYQGEANSDRVKEYQRLFVSLIEDWRNHWKNDQLPFLYVQLPNYAPVKSDIKSNNWAFLRESQAVALNLPQTGMAVTYDIGEWNDIHPANKLDVGKRLALIACNMVYNDKQVIYSAPVYRSMNIAGDTIILNFYMMGSHFKIKPGSGHAISGFEISGSDKKFITAHAEIAGDTVRVFSNDLRQPVAVRYAWSNNPEGANLFNQEGLPVSTFRTDNW